MNVGELMELKHMLRLVPWDRMTGTVNSAVIDRPGTSVSTLEFFSSY